MSTLHSMIDARITAALRAARVDPYVEGYARPPRIVWEDCRMSLYRIVFGKTIATHVLLIRRLFLVAASRNGIFGRRPPWSQQVVPRPRAPVVFARR